MVFAAATAITPCFPVALTKIQAYQRRNRFLINVRKHNVSVICSAKLPSAGNFLDPVKRVGGLKYTKDILGQVIPGSVKSFPWKKAESVALHKFLIWAKETIKWSLLAFFALSSLSDILYTISRNRELVIPFGLFAGCTLTNYFAEISRGLFPEHGEGPIPLRFVGISCLFVLVKVMAVYFFPGKHFLLHVANGGLMQVVWNWMKLPKLHGEEPLQKDALHEF